MTHMTEDMATFVPVSPWAGLPPLHTAGGGVKVIDRDGLGIACVLAKKSRKAALVERVREQYGIELPQRPARAHAGEMGFIATGPETWLVTSEQAGPALSVSLQQTFGGVASISDQSDGYAVLHLAGPKVRETLAKLVPIDVHPRAFPVAMAAVTVAAHIGVTLWRLEDEADGPVFDMALYRSMAGSFWYALSDSAAEFGFEAGRTRTPRVDGRRPALRVP